MTPAAGPVREQPHPSSAPRALATGEAPARRAGRPVHGHPARAEECHIKVSNRRDDSPRLDSAHGECPSCAGSEGLVRCPYCAEEIQDAALVCRYCGRDVLGIQPWEREARAMVATGRHVAAAQYIVAATGVTIEQATALVDQWEQAAGGSDGNAASPGVKPAFQDSDRQPFLGILRLVALGVLGSAIVIAGVVWIGSDSSGISRRGRPGSHDHVGAVNVCEQAVRQRLRSPSTARFPWLASERAVHLGDGRYRVSAFVDAQNAFGATVRTEFVCEAVWRTGDRWRVDRLELGD
jgi:hypothetical protein